MLGLKLIALATITWTVDESVPRLLLCCLAMHKVIFRIVISYTCAHPMSILCNNFNDQHNNSVPVTLKFSCDKLCRALVGWKAHVLLHLANVIKTKIRPIAVVLDYVVQKNVYFCILLLDYDNMTIITWNWHFFRIVTLVLWCVYADYSISQEICTRFCCALLCCGYAIVHNEFTWSIYPYSSGLLCWHWGNR